MEFRGFISKNSKGFDVFEKDRNSKKYITFWLNTQESVTISNVTNILLNNITVSKWEISVVLSEIASKKGKDMFYEKWDFLFVATWFVHQVWDNNMKTLNISFNFKKVSDNKYYLTWLKFSVSETEKEKLEIMLNRSEAAVLSLFLEKYWI